MRHIFKKICLICLAFSACFAPISSQEERFVAGEYIIQSQNDQSVEAINKSILSNRSAGSAGPYTFKPLMKQPFNVWLVTIDPARVSSQEAMHFLHSQPGITRAWKNRVITPRVTPNDPDFTKQWQYINDGTTTGSVVNADMDMDLGWDITTGGLTPEGDTIVICVIDDGINGLHEDIADNLWLNRHEIPNNGVDDDKNGYIDDYRGWNITTANDNVYAGGSHGTPVSGIIGAKGNNGKGVSGINWNIKIMSVNYGQANEANAIASYAYAYAQRKLYNETKGARGAFIVATNTSWGVDNLDADDAPIWCAMYDSLGRVGILNCGATANQSFDVDINGDMPTSCGSEYLIAVTNLGRNDVKVSAAGYGKKSVDIGAYGQQVYTLSRSGYSTFGGTSGATPHVAGIIGLLYAAPCHALIAKAKSNPAAAALIAKDMILHGIVPNPSLENYTTTGGKLNAQKALRNIMQLCQPCSVPSGIVLDPADLAIKITWHSDHGSAKIRLRYRPVGKTTWTEQFNVEKETVIKGLQFCTEYEVQLGSDCGIIPSAYSYSKYVKTTGCCEAPTIEPLKVTDKKIIGIGCTSIQDAIYKIQYKSSGSNWVDTSITSSSFLLFNIPECTAYTFRAQAVCKKYGNTSVSTPEVNVSTNCGSCTANNYCPSGHKNATEEWVESFILNKVENRSGTSEGGYRDFTGINQITLDAGKSYDFMINAAYSGSVVSDYFKIYIDYNQDGQWTSDELAFKSASPVSKELTGNLKIPLKAIQGFTKLRLIMSYEDFEGACDDIKFEYGEVEDYCVKIANAACINSTILKPTMIEKFNALFTRSLPLSPKDTARIQFRIKGKGEWKQASGRDTIRLTNLEECTLYEYRYQVNCDSIYSDYSVIDTFTTACKNGTNNYQLAVKITPNPAIDQLNIETNGSGQIRTCRIYDISARECLLLSPSDDLPVKSLDISALSSGWYFLVITTADGKSIQNRFIKI
jgi:hypothetical protein